MEKLPSAFQPGDKVGLQMLIDLMQEAKDARINAVNFSNSKVKYNIEVPVNDGYFRLANIDSAFLHAPIENGFHYNDKVAVEARSQRKTDSPFSHGSWHNGNEILFPVNEDGISSDKLIDIDGKRKTFRVGWYASDEKQWYYYHEENDQPIDQKNMKWTELPLS